MTGDHETFDELAVGWALSALEPEDEAVFAAHLADCDRCARTVAETVEVMASLATDLPLAEPAAELRSRLHDAVEQAEQSIDTPTAPRPVATGFPDYDDARVPVSTERPSSWRRAVPVLLAAAAVVVIVALGVWNVALNQSMQQAEATAEEQARIMSALLTPGSATIAPVTDAEGQRVATVVARNSEVQVITHGLQRNDPADSTYVVWGIRSDEPVALGTFDVVDTQMDMRTVGSSRTGLDGYPVYGISLEPGRQAPPAPTGIVVSGEATQ